MTSIVEPENELDLDFELGELNLDPLARLSKDLKNAAVTLGDDTARFLVDYYYTMQDARTNANNVARAARANENEPHDLIDWCGDNTRRMENTIKSVLGIYAEGKEAGEGAMSLTGIGPVITAGLLAHIDIHKAPTVGHIWSFAGLNPEQHWGKGEKRPWNAKLKTLTWKIGESFVKFQNHPNDVYGKFYRERKEYEIAKNEAGEYSERAAQKLSVTNIQKKEYRAIYESGKLPPGHIHSSAKRWVTKLFLAHFHHVLHETVLGTPPPKPYIIDRGNHAHIIAPPNWPIV